MTPEEGYQEALRRIQAAKESRATELDLSGLGLVELPEELGELTFLESLDLRGNLVTNISVLGSLQGLIELKLGNGWGLPLRDLSIGTSDLSDLKPLSRLLHLQRLVLMKTKVNDLTSLSGLLQLKELNCGWTQVRNLRPLSRLSQLKVLNCRDTHVSDLSPLSGLSQLQVLDCSDTQVSDLSPLSGLSQLQVLDCSDTQVSDLSPLSNLSRLKILKCRSSQVSDLSPLSCLLGLQRLDCCLTQVSDLRPLSGLPDLLWLNCSATKVSDLSPLRELLQLNNLSCDFNIIKNIPLELTLQPGLIRVLRAYWASCDRGFVQNYHIKLVLVGNGRAGKTTLAHNLIHGYPPDQAIEERTHGIALSQFKLNGDSLKHPMEVQIWDFGGQEIYHATHRLFLGSRAVYLLLWHDDDPVSAEDGDHPIRYWFDLIQQQNDVAPVLLVKNKIDLIDLPEPAEYSEIARNCTQSLRISAQQGKGISTLRAALAEAINEYRHAWDFKIPTSWLRVRERLEQMRNSGIRHIEYEKYLTICEEESVATEEVVLQYLNDSGSLVYREGLFSNQIILDQNWFIALVYRLFDPKLGYCRSIEEHGGRFYGHETLAYWPNHTDDERELILDYMLNAQMAYRESRWDVSFAEQRFVIPALLPEQSRFAAEFWSDETQDDARFMLSFPVLHRVIIEKLIVALTEQGDYKEAWRQGIWLQDKPSGSKLWLEYQHPDKTSYQLILRVRGGNIERAWQRFQKCLKSVMGEARFETQLWLKSQESDSSKWLEQAEIKIHKQARHQTISKESESGEEDVKNNVGQLGDQKALPPAKIFVSYTHADERDRKACDEFRKRVNLLVRRFPGKIELFVDKNNMRGGDHLEQTICGCLDDCDLFVAIVSPDFFNSNYCIDIELAYAKEIQRSIIPIHFRQTDDWLDLFGRTVSWPINGLALNHAHWGDLEFRDDRFWADVGSGVKQWLLEHYERLGESLV